MQQPGLFDSSPIPARNHSTSVMIAPTFESFRDAAREMLRLNRSPDQIWWVETDEAEPPGSASTAQARVSAQFVKIAQFVACHASPDRWTLLYRVLWRLTRGEPYLLALSGDPDVARMRRYEKMVRRDLHKMKAFVRFRQVSSVAGERFVAWFEPDHAIVKLAGDFFVRRFTNMRFSVLTPVGCVHWEGEGQLVYTQGLSAAVKLADSLDDLWKAYYENIFNPARVKVDAMRSEMPQKYWKNLPEAQLIPALLLAADARTDQMIQAAPQVSVLNCGSPPEGYQTGLQRSVQDDSRPALARIADATRACRACELWEPASQAVPGEGTPKARIMLVGEAPGDQEDLLGRPFVGPAGQLLDTLLAELNATREMLYLTNAVKHFKFRVTARRRLHQRPQAREVAACRNWLLQEIEVVNPQRIVCLGATAAAAVLGHPIRLRDVPPLGFELQGRQVMPTIHPAAVLRAADPSSKRAHLRADLQQALLGLI
ncbi:MAG: UdgX family uracil-DNA binding protein [Gammaproteobacteria bacterium]|nr:UdgX family uracil-DNA binding protein [Gammaproteobacteria bacterium]